MSNRNSKATESNEGSAGAVAVEEAAEKEDLLGAIRRLAKPRAHLPEDYALNHGHYVFGEPKK